MKIARIALQCCTGAAVALGVAVFASGEASAVGELTRLPPRLNPSEIRITKAAVQSAIEKATGPIASECKGAQAAAQAYAACKERCATQAQTAPITPAELERCGNQSAEDCANQLIASRARACINAPPPQGCRDEYAKLQVENAECKSCNELKAATERAVDVVKAQARAVAQAEAALAQARAQLDAAEARASALAARASRTCAAAQR